MWPQASFGDMIYFYFMKNFTYLFPILKVCQNPIFNMVITIQIRPSTPCSSSVCDVPTPPPSSQNKTPVLPPLLLPYHHFVWLKLCLTSQIISFQRWLRDGDWTTHVLLLSNSSTINLKWMMHLALSTYCTPYVSYFNYDGSTDIE